MNEDWSKKFLDHLERVSGEIEKMKEDIRENPDEFSKPDNDEADEYLKSTSKWVDVKGLYRIAIAIDQFMGCENVVLDVFRHNTDNVPFNPEEYVPDCIPEGMLKEKSSSVLEHLEESFTFEEIEQIREYFGKFKFITIGKSELCSLPRDGRIWPTGAHRYDDIMGQGFIVFCESENYSLPFDIAGYYDLWNGLPFNTDEITDQN